MGLVLLHQFEFLNALACAHFADIDVAFGVYGQEMGIGEFA